MGVRGQHDLFARQVDRVERVQELLLHRRLVRQEMNVVDGQQVDLPEPPAESLQLLGLQGHHVLVGEILGRDIQPADRRPLVGHGVAEALQQVRFAHAVATVDEQRIERAAVGADHRHRRVVRQLVLGTDHERIEAQFQSMRQDRVPPHPRVFDLLATPSQRNGRRGRPR